MFNSIRHKIIASLVLAMAVTVVIAGLVAYQNTRQHEDEISLEMGLAAAQACASMLEFADDESGILDPNSAEYAECREAMRRLCKNNHMDYMYAYRYDDEMDKLTYLFCVADDNEDDELVARERAFGTVVESPASKQELAALDGHETEEPLELNNQFGNMLSWFCRVDGWSGNVLAGADYSLSEQRFHVFQTTAHAVALLLLALLGLLFFQLGVLRKNVFDPIHVIAKRMRGFSPDTAGSFEPIRFDSHDEMSEIANAFSKMAGDIDAYLKDIERMTSERVQSSVEMDVARRIQLGMVPERTRIDDPGSEVCGLARTAREVGGDFYDCLNIDDGRVALVVGDVSGKGVAASLFMAMVKTMIRDNLAFGESPAAVLNLVNDHLCQQNPEGMFVTVFAAVYDPATGIAQFANAGHMPPLLVGRDVRVLQTEPGVLLGLFEDAGIEDGEVQLAKGEALLLYTDGVNEAVNPRNEFFGEDRFVAAMRGQAPYSTAQALVDQVVEAVGAFVEDREQFDDLTLLAILRTAEPLELPVDIGSLAAMRQTIMATACDENLKLTACLICEEAFVNVVSYSGAERIWFEATEDNGALRFVLSDDGDPFDPTSTALDEKDFEELEEGGMGISLMRELASDLRYRREAGRNVLSVHLSE